VENVGSGASRPRIGLVLSGGGARGAYEVGVLSWVLDELPRRLGHPLRLDVVTGTSVGAIHACYVAATMGSEGAGGRLADVWSNLDVGGVYQLGLVDVVRLPWRLFGLGAAIPKGDRLSGLLDTRPLERLVRETIPWNRLRDRIDGGHIDALAIAATDIATGKSVVWVDRRGGKLDGWARDPFVIARPTAITPAHALASAAIPFLFPALKVDGHYFCDGGLRLNTPLAPALRLGVDRLLVVGLRHVPTPEEEAALAPAREESYASLTYLTGKVLNALLLDHIDYDVDRLQLVNAILDTGVRAYGPEFLPRINETIRALRGTPYRIVRNLYLQPSRDLGVMASECLRHQRRARGIRDWLSDAVVRYAVHGVVEEADLLSYLFFDRCYATHLIALGRADAAARGDELLALFADDQSVVDGSDPTGGYPSGRT
jgi:NTE family protein